MFYEAYVYQTHAGEMHAYKLHAYEMHACEVHACEVHAYETHGDAHEVPAYEGFCEDLARQNTVAHLSQLQLRFRRRHTWVSMLSHMGFSRRRGVLKTTI
jgi:hypothetical protein